MATKAYKFRNGVKMEVEYISIPKKVVNFSAAFYKWMHAGFPKRPRNQIAECLSICHGCDYWKPSGNFGLGECSHPKCGCTKFKPQWATEDCPIHLWPKLDNSEKTIRS